MFAIFPPFMYYSWWCAFLLFWVTVATLVNFSSSETVDDIYNFSKR